MVSGPDIFISYSREDRKAARRFAERFADEGFSVWWDAALHAGETFDEVIETALKASRAVVVLWSPRSVTSRWVRAEATLADRRNKLVPVTIEPCDRPIIFELTHTTDLSNWDGNTTDAAWRTVIKDVNRLVERASREASHGAAAALADTPQPPRSRGPSAPGPAEPRNGSTVAAHKKVDNVAFARGNWSPGGPRAEGRTPPSESEDRTQFYTRSDGYLDDEELHCLELTIGDRLEKRYVVSPLGLKIGRAAPADVILADSRVSRSHCLVELMEGGLQVSDLNSTNGTFVDGERIEGSSSLPVGSVLKVGSVSFRHELRARAEV